MPGTRVLLYSHDSFGLGHLRRTSTIAAGIARLAPETSLLVVSGSPRPDTFPLPPGADLLKLPAITKDERGVYCSRTLNASLPEMLRLRSTVIAAAARSFEPSVILVDHSAMGVGQELLPMLAEQRRRGTARLVLGLRDVLDTPERGRAELGEPSIRRALEDLYHEILVYGDPAILDVPDEYGLSEAVREKTRYVGVVGADEPSPESFDDAPLSRRPGRPLRILVTTGGGQDGFELHHAVLRSLQVQPSTRYRADVVVGPLLSPHQGAKLRGLAEGMSGVRLIDAASDYRSLLRDADVVVSMGGYNTVYEALTLGKRLLVMPRTMPRAEQAERARRLSALGLLNVLDESDLPSRGRVWGKIVETAFAGRSLRSLPFPVDGAERTARTILGQAVQDGMGRKPQPTDAPWVLRKPRLVGDPR